MPVDRLTRREHQIADAYAGGASYREIAARLFIAPTTVRTHLRTIYRKLGVASKIELLKTLERTTADAPPRSIRRVEHASPEPEDRGRSFSRAGIGAAGHELPARVARLREDALLALAGGLFEHEPVEPRLRLDELQLRAVIEALPAVVLLKDQALRYVFANRFFLGQWRLRSEHVVGRTQQEVFSGGLGFAWSRATDDRDARVLETGEATDFYVVRVPLAPARERMLWARKLPLCNQAGACSHVLTIGIDITPLERVPRETAACLPSAEAPLPAPIAARLPGARASARLLVVDAEAEVRQMAVAALERSGHTVETAASGREALAVLALQPVDLIVFDVEMSDLDGPALHHALVAHHPELPTRLLFTTRASLPADLRAFVSGAGLEVLEKPFAASDIVARIDAKLANAGLAAHVQGT